MRVIYSDYSEDRVGWFFGLRGWQLAVVAGAALPVFGAIQAQRWQLAGELVVLWLVIVVLTVIRVRGRSAVGWLWASGCQLAATVSGARSFVARAAQGLVEDPGQVDLPGLLQSVQIHDGPPHGPNLERTAIIQDHASRTWAVTAAVVHPGIGMAGAAERDRQAAGLAALIELASRTELVDEVILLVRTVPDDGAEREIWVQRHRSPTGPPVARVINDDLQRGLSQASVRTETFVTIVVPEGRMGRHARESGGGVGGRARVLYSLMGEVEAQLRGGMAMTDVRWLTSPGLALACRTGFAPGDRVGIIDALAESETDSSVNAEVPWSMAGPSGADTPVRHYSHDAWNSVTATLRLPTKGGLMGALAPVLVPTEPGERRSFMVAFPILKQSAAERRSDAAEFAADMGGALRQRAGVKPRARHRNDARKAYGMDEKLAGGSAMTRPYAVCCVTVPKTLPASEFGRRLDASVRRAGFAPLRLDLAQDAGFAASTVPLGVSLNRRSQT